ncbi:hypothetical protein FNV43_RR05193 [Rhamnella rubrinervis]|uniref:Uncharacterized protein n=1 Tax=Rhamnella rubrinervis TaxID=2594499 RepID=A0A8K0MRC4_9ROSA|nr:hypothetical protein FNV43_RR05193 [Rhamnella rubrinervis]
MGFNSRQKKPSLFNLFKFRKARRVDHDAMDDARRVWPSDEDRVRWVADPAIDRKAQDFITKTYKNIVLDSEPHIVTVNPAGKV